MTPTGTHPSPAPPAVAVAPEVRRALDAGHPVVALETAVLTHGLPRTPMARPCELAAWDPALPANLALSLLLDATVRAAGAVPATVGMLDGTLHVGLDRAQLERLGRDERARKLSTRDLGAAADAREAAAICAAHWQFAPAGGVLVANPPPERWAIPNAEVEATIAAAMLDAVREGVRGAAVTPFLLDRVQRATGGRTVAANVAVLEGNARAGAEIARALAATA